MNDLPHNSPVPDDEPLENIKFRDKWINRFVAAIFAVVIASGAIVLFALALRAARGIAGL